MDDIFCKIIKGEIPSFTCYEDDYVKCIMDANPETIGHTLIIPKKHITNVLEMDNETMVHIHETAKMLIKKMESTYPNIVGVRQTINYGILQVVKHYHLHLIPAYKDFKEPNMTQEEMCELLKDTNQ